MPAQALWRIWLKTVAAAGRRPAVIDAVSGSRASFGELTRSAERLSEHCREARGRMVAFCLPNGARWMAAFLALQKSGAAALPLDPTLPATGLRDAALALAADFLWESDGLVRLGSRRRKRAAICCVKVTSGTSGALKPVPCTAENLVADGRQIARTMGIRRADRNLAIIPMGHSYGLGNLVMPLILQGTAVVSAAEWTPRQALAWIPAHRVTVLPSVPAVFRMLAELDAGPLRPLRLAISAGAPLPPETARAFWQRYRVKIHNFYGASETGGIAYDRDGNASLSGRGVGQPLAGVRVRIDARHRVHVRSPAVIAPGFFMLPDLGEWDKRGGLQLIGRLGAVANVGGKKVHPAEVERLIRGVEGVTDAWVTVLRDLRGRDYLAAAVETRRPLSELEEALAAKAAPWKLPRRYLLAAALPRTIRGKLDTKRIKPGLEDSLPEREPASPTPPGSR